MIGKTVSQALGVVDGVDHAPHRIINGCITNIMDLHDVFWIGASEVPKGNAQSCFGIDVILTLLLSVSSVSRKEYFIQLWFKNRMKTIERCPGHSIYSPEEGIAELGGDSLVERLALPTALPSLSPKFKVREPMQMVQEQAIDLNEEQVAVRDVEIIWRDFGLEEVLVR